MTCPYLIKPSQDLDHFNEGAGVRVDVIGGDRGFNNSPLESTVSAQILRLSGYTLTCCQVAITGEIFSVDQNVTGIWTTLTNEGVIVHPRKLGYDSLSLINYQSTNAKLKWLKMLSCAQLAKNDYIHSPFIKPSQEFDPL